jgi:hypothetical protein
LEYCGEQDVVNPDRLADSFERAVLVDEESKMHNNHVLWEVAKERHTELMDMTGGLVLARTARVYRPRRRDRLFAKIGSLLVNVGTRIKNRHEPAVLVGSRLDSSKEPSYLK